MDSKRINLIKILKSAIAGIVFSLACLLISVFAILPFKAVTVKADIWNYEAIEKENISFIAAKTKVRTADEYRLETYSDRQDTNFTAHNYEYIDEQVSYYSNSSSSDKLDNYSSSEFGFGNNSLHYIDGINESLKTFDSIDAESNYSSKYIPSNAKYFYNSTTQKIENIFYDYVKEGDFVLLDNYTSHNVEPHATLPNKLKNFDVENFYISFGSKPTESDILLDDLEVEAYLYQPTEVHQLIIPENDPIEYTDSNLNKKNIYYFNQFLDLRNLQGKKSADTSDTYDINDQQGKYVFIFEFSAYNKVTETAIGSGTFTFTFYLLDGAVYNSYPIINTNNNLEYIQQGANREYYYNYNTDAPTITYNPTQYNLSYKRDDVDNVTSEYTKGTFSYEGKYYPREEIVFKNNGAIIKRVYILTYYYNNKTTMEH